MRKMKRWGAVFCAALLLFTAQDGVNVYANNTTHQTVIGNQQNVVNEVELQGDSTDGVTPFVEQKNITMYQGTIFNIRWLNKSDAASVTYDVEDEEMLTVSEKGQKAAVNLVYWNLGCLRIGNDDVCFTSNYEYNFRKYIIWWR